MRGESGIERKSRIQGRSSTSEMHQGQAVQHPPQGSEMPGALVRTQVTTTTNQRPSRQTNCE